jgi:hypothetical protein
LQHRRDAERSDDFQMKQLTAAAAGHGDDLGPGIDGAELADQLDAVPHRHEESVITSSGR